VLADLHVRVARVDGARVTVVAVREIGAAGGAQPARVLDAPFDRAACLAVLRDGDFAADHLRAGGAEGDEVTSFVAVRLRGRRAVRVGLALR